ncbi:hypothetical protein D0864_01729 [Hortaea werneckii]|uniref:DNA/RNA-binding domain-containing protein n=1 Tax=Hortaea werneckii TaxID=91943 RepID=A0A3M7H5F7_HORWE|nr:hypothetical protein D0864_01729 [Hortaea werneckii]
MEDLLAQERVAEQYVHALLKDASQPIGNLLQAFDAYRQLCQVNILADFATAEKREAKLWHAHTEGRKFFSRHLKDLRKKEAEQPVAIRNLIKLYLTFLKSSERFYRGYVHALSATFGGIPELDAVAQNVKSLSRPTAGESLQSPITTELRAAVLKSCHQTLIYLGDLSRYRASDKLDKEPKFGPAIGYYGLACTLQPASGMGFHQQAVIALEQKDHLRAVYNLYRAIVVAEPHPHAPNNLKLEFDKIQNAFKKGELLPKGGINDPEAPKKYLTGWFVRMHGMCFSGEKFRGHDELESELLGQLKRVIGQPAVDADHTLMRMVIVNVAAQYNAMETFKMNPTGEWQNAFFWFLRLNLRTFTTLLETLHDELSTSQDPEDQINDPADTLTPALRRVLPSLRLYSAWLLSNAHIIAGLANDDMLKRWIDGFWKAYARAVGIIADEDVLGIWTLEDYRVSYMLEEDADSIGFKPLQNEWTKLWRNWYQKDNVIPKPRFWDAHVSRMPLDEEMLARLMGLLDDGLFLAHDAPEAPISLLGTKIYHGNAPEEHVQAFEKAQQELKGRPWPKPKPLSYAAAAAKARAQKAQQAAQPSEQPNGTAAGSSRSRQAQLSRMVDELVDEDEVNNPVTPPQQHATHPAVVSNGDVYANGAKDTNGLFHNVDEMADIPSYQPKQPSTTVPPASSTTMRTPPTLRTPKDSLAANSLERMQSVSTIWNNLPANQISSSPGFPSGLPVGTLTSPAQHLIRHSQHSRGNSASSIHSKASQTNPNHAPVSVVGGDPWAANLSPNAAAVPPPGQAPPPMPTDGYARFSQSAGMASPLLFGAGNNMWSTTSHNSSFRNVTPPNGQGG